MKTKLSLLIATIATSITLTYLQSVPTLAQPKQRFYCGSNDDQKEPATILVTQGLREERTFVVWKTNPERCESVSRLFQKLYIEKSKTNFSAGRINLQRQAFICLTKSIKETCLPEDKLFDVDSNTQGRKLADELNNRRSIEQ
jgi:Circadian oscillating protein COP23